MILASQVVLEPSGETFLKVVGLHLLFCIDSAKLTALFDVFRPNGVCCLQAWQAGWLNALAGAVDSVQRYITLQPIASA